MPEHPAPDDATASPPGQGSGRPAAGLPVHSWRPRVYRPRPWLAFALALLAGAVLATAAMIVLSLR